MVERTLYDTEITAVTGDYDVAFNSVVDLIDDDETDSALFVLNPNYEVNIGDELRFYDYKQDDIFAGVVRDIKNKVPREVAVYKFDLLLEERIVNDVYEGYTIEGLIEYIVTNYSSLTFSSTFVSGVTLDRYVSKNKNALEIIRDLIALVPELTFVVSKDKVFSLYIKGTIDSGVSLSNGLNCDILGGWTQDTSKQVTRLTLVGEKQVQQDKVQLFSGDATTTVFTINEIPSSIKVEVDSGAGFVELELDVDGQRTGTYSVNPATKQVTFFTAPSTGTDNIRIIYTFEIDITIEYDSDVDIQTQYGIIEKKITKKYLTNMDDAFNYSSQYVEKFGEPLLKARILLTSTYDITNLTIGSSIFVTDAINKVDGSNISQSFNIRRVTREFPAGGVVIEVGEDTGTAFNLIREIKYNVSQLYEQDNNSDIIQKSQIIKNQVFIDVDEEVELQLYRDLPDDYMYLGDANDTPVYANIGDGTERPLKDATESPAATEYFITDKSFWNTPDAEVAEHGNYVSWVDINEDPSEIITLENGDSLITENSNILTTE